MPSSSPQFQAGEVLVTDKTDPDWEPIMKKAAAIVTNRGGRTCHAAIVSRELGCRRSSAPRTARSLRDGQEVTVSCAEGETGASTTGAAALRRQRRSSWSARPAATKIMMNVGNPEEAFGCRSFPTTASAWRARSSSSRRTSRSTRWRCWTTTGSKTPAGGDRRLTAGYDDKPQFFVDKLAEGVAMIAAAFYPKDVIVRLSDFKTNEYANLIGGRGTSRPRRTRCSASAAPRATTTRATATASRWNAGR
jgi:pyruvate, water dikinase